MKLSGLPYDVFKFEIVELFSTFSINNSKVTIELIRGKKTGFAIVELNNSSDVERALVEVHGKQLKTRWVRVDRASLIVEISHAISVPQF